MDFLNAFPKFTSHYTTSNRVYFSPDLNLQKLFNLYKENAVENHEQHVSRPIFNKCFKEFNTGFYIPKTDTCNTCDRLHIQKQNSVGEEKIVIANELEEHHQKAKYARACYEEASGKAKKDSSMLVFTFDMQQTVPLPRINTSIVFYKRQLWIYNLHDI